MTDSDDFDGVLTEDDVPHYTRLRPILSGSFNLSSAAIPYFQTVLSLDEVAKELKLVENLPSDLRSKWRLEELFQREIDWERVELDIVNGYLRRPDKLKFFNSLTVALLPLNASKTLDSEYGETPLEPDLRDALKNEPWSVNNVGGVQLITNTKNPNGYIRWDPNRIFPATIDGQHRLASLQMLLNDGNLTQSQLETKVSVLFLVIDERAGFGVDSLGLDESENPVLTVVREVFVDLNLHAKEVSRSRRILLDDQDIESRCLRSLLATRVGDRETAKIPLGLVHWQHNVTAKFNMGKSTGPFVTTVELLYSIISDLLDFSRPKDPLDAKQVRRFIKSIEEALSISQTIKAKPEKYPGLSPLISYVEKNHLVEGFEVPFVNLPSPYLRAAVDCFSDVWHRLITKVLLEFKPYREFVAQVDTEGGIDGDLGFYLVQPRKAQIQQLKDWGESQFEIIDEPLERLHKLKTSIWPFYAVFQKGLLRATANAWRHFGVRRGGKEGDLDLFGTEWLRFLDDMWDRGVFTLKAPMKSGSSDTLWAGISLNPASASVRWSESSVQRISALLLLWWYFYSEGLRQPSRFLKAAGGKRSAERFPEAKEAIRALKSGMKTAVVRSDEEVDEAEIEKRVTKRLRTLIELAVNEGIEEPDPSDDETDDVQSENVGPAEAPSLTQLTPEE